MNHGTQNEELYDFNDEELDFLTVIFSEEEENEQPPVKRIKLDENLSHDNDKKILTSLLQNFKVTNDNLVKASKQLAVEEMLKISYRLSEYDIVKLMKEKNLTRYCSIKEIILTTKFNKTLKSIIHKKSDNLPYNPFPENSMVYNRDIEIVMEMTGETRCVSIALISKYKGDIVNAILSASIL